MELGRVKSGAASPTFKFGWGAGGGAGFCAEGVCVGVGCAAAIDAAANKKTTQRARLIMVSPYNSSLGSSESLPRRAISRQFSVPKSSSQSKLKNSSRGDLNNAGVPRRYRCADENERLFPTGL